MNNVIEPLLNPYSIAVIGASDKPLSVGCVVLSNILAGGFTGQVFPVNPKYQTIQGHTCFASVTDIESAVDLAVILTPAHTVPKILTECGDKKIHYAIILSAGFGEISGEGARLQQALIDIAHRYDIRFIGPNCLGMMRPGIGLNATFQSTQVLSGNIALVSQSGAIVAAILDWAVEEDIGFSTVLSLGNHADVDFGDILEYLARDPLTNCILLYIEGIHDAPRFMEGLRAATREKPVIVIKAGRNVQGSNAAVSHTGAMIGADDVFDIALRQAGAVRVKCIKELFVAASVFTRSKLPQGGRLAIVTNGGGAGVMAADCAASLHIQLPTMTQKTLAKFNTVLPHGASPHNPIDILGDATPERYFEVVNACLQDDNCDAVLVILVPVAMSAPLNVAAMLVELQKTTEKPILACWMGQQQVKSSWSLFAQHHLPCFTTPETAMSAFSYLIHFLHNQQLMLQAPEMPAPRAYDTAMVKQVMDTVIAEKRTLLTTVESKAILQAFGIPVTQMCLATNAEEALHAAKMVGFPVVMKIHSPDISHKQDVGGVQLNITQPEGVTRMFNQMMESIQRQRPDAMILGVTIEHMYKTAYDRELMIGVLRDPVFGPVINFGAGGSLVEVMQDRALALPPLHHDLIQHLIHRTHVARILGEFRGQPAVNMRAIEEVLLRVSDMVAALPCIQEMDINPLVVNDKELIALDARIVVREEQCLI